MFKQQKLTMGWMECSPSSIAIQCIELGSAAEACCREISLVLSTLRKFISTTQNPDAEGRLPGCSGTDVSRQFLDDGLVRLTWY